MKTLQTYWDPLAEPITSDSFLLHTEKFLSRAKKYENNPKSVKISFYLFLSIPIISGIIYILSVGFNYFLAHIVIFSSLPVIFYYASIKELQQKMILHMLSKENGWLYNPEENKTNDRINGFKLLFPSIFHQGNSNSQIIFNQIWGSQQIKEKTSFWLSDFQYTIGSGKSKSTPHHTIVIIKLRQNLPISFELENKSIMSFGKEFKTESEEFNRLFRVKMNDKNPNSIELFKILSPSLQVRFIDLANIIPIWRIMLHKDMMLLDIKTKLFEPKHTNFIKEVAVDIRDKEHFESYINSIVEVSSEMLQFMD